MTSKQLYENAKGYGFNKVGKIMTRMIKGNSGNTGMVKKIGDLNEYNDRETISVDTKNGKIKTVFRDVQKYQYAGGLFKQLPESNHVKFGFILFQTVASIDREKAERLDKECRENGGQCFLISKDTETSEEIRRQTEMTSV